MRSGIVQFMKQFMDSDFNYDVNPIKTKSPIELYSNSKNFKILYNKAVFTLKNKHFFLSQLFSKHLVVHVVYTVNIIG